MMTLPSQRRNSPEEGRRIATIGTTEPLPTEGKVATKTVHPKLASALCHTTLTLHKLHCYCLTKVFRVR